MGGASYGNHRHVPVSDMGGASYGNHRHVPVVGRHWPIVPCGVRTAVYSGATEWRSICAQICSNPGIHLLLLMTYTMLLNFVLHINSIRYNITIMTCSLFSVDLSFMSKFPIDLISFPNRYSFLSVTRGGGQYSAVVKSSACGRRVLWSLGGHTHW